MAEKGDPRVLQHVARSLRLRTGMTEQDFGAACRIDQANISRYEMGKVAPSEESLRRMAATARMPWPLVVMMIRFFTALVSAADRATGDLPASRIEGLALDRVLLDSFELAVVPYLVEEAAAAEAQDRPAEEARREAAEICAALLPFPPAERRRLLGLSVRAKRSWAVAEALAHASERAAADGVDEARELVELALEVARQVPGEAERTRTEGYCTGFLANVERVATEFDPAGVVFERCWTLWREGEAASLPLAEWRLLDLEASLRRAQHRFAESRKRLDQALATCDGGDLAVGRLLVKKGNVLEQAGDFIGALEALEEATPTVEGSGDLNLIFGLRFNTVVNLVHLERYAEAEALLPAVRELAIEQDRQLHLIRLRWLSSKLAAGLGREEEAVAGLEQVVHELTVLPLAYEAALAGLDLAVLYLKEGRTADVKALAVAMGWIFEAKGITREALQALTLFCAAAKQETATVALVQQVIAEVERAQ